jgi:hypothetical protein
MQQHRGFPLDGTAEIAGAHDLARGCGNLARTGRCVSMQNKCFSATVFLLSDEQDKIRQPRFTAPELEYRGDKQMPKLTKKEGLFLRRLHDQGGRIDR